MKSPADRRKLLVLLVDCFEDPYGGTEGQIHALLEGLPTGWRAEMWVLRGSGWWKDHGFPCKVRDLGFGRLASPATPFRLHALARQIRRLGVDVIQTYMNDASVIGPLLGARSGVPVWVARRDLGFWQTPRLLELLRRTGRGASGIIANCEAVAEHTRISEHIPPHLLRVVPNGHDPRRFDVDPEAGLRQRLGIPEGAPLVGLLANVKPLKRHDDLLDALARLAPEHPDVHALLIGEPVAAGEPLAERAARRGLATRVHTLLAPGNAIGLLRHLDMGVLCSDTEGLSNAVIEYLACGLPVVATAVGGTPELVQDGVNGFLYEPGDVEALARHLGSLLADPARGRRMGEASRARFEHRYTRERMIASTVRVWTEPGEVDEGTDMRWQVVRTIDELEGLSREWDGLLGPHGFFAGPDWALAWMEHLPPDARPHVLVARDGQGRLVGLLPLVRRGDVLGIPGGGDGADHVDVVARPERADAVARGALVVLASGSWERVDLPHLSEGGALRNAARALDAPLPSLERLATSCPYVAFEGTWEAYVAAHLSYAYRRHVRRYPKRFRAREGARVERVTEAADASRAVDRFYALHDKRFAARGELSAMASQRVRAVHRTLAQRAARSGRLAMTFLVLDGRDVACEYGFRHGGRLHAFQSGFDAESSVDSPGLALQAIILEEDVFGGHLVEYDFLDGEEDYKLRWATGARRLFDVTLYPATVAGRFRHRIRGGVRLARDLVRPRP